FLDVLHLFELRERDGRLNARIGSRTRVEVQQDRQICFGADCLVVAHQIVRGGWATEGTQRSQNLQNLCAAFLSESGQLANSLEIGMRDARSDGNTAVHQLNGSRHQVHALVEIKQL